MSVPPIDEENSIRDERENAPLRILFIDAYDSFSHNIIAALLNYGNCNVASIRMDDLRYTGTNKRVFHELVKEFDAIVAGPGPGNPTNPNCVGLIAELWELPDDISRSTPVLGICLGFQSLAVSMGAEVERMAIPRHGTVEEIVSKPRSLHSEVEPIRAVLYNSLRVKIGHGIESVGIERPRDLWEGTSKCPDLKPIAWHIVKDGGATLMACQHGSKPYMGIQFHPESAHCNSSAKAVLGGFLNTAKIWRSGGGGHFRSSRKYKDGELGCMVGPPFFPRTNIREFRGSLPLQTNPHTPHMDCAEESAAPRRVRGVTWQSMNAACSVATVCRALKLEKHEVVLLESATRRTESDYYNLSPHITKFPSLGRFSIIGILKSAFKICYYVRDRVVELRNSHDKVDSREHCEDIWGYLKAFMRLHKFENGCEKVPFWGGLVGVVSYEACLDTFDVDPPRTKFDSRPDICFMWVNNSIVMDHTEGRAYIQTLLSGEGNWVVEMMNLLDTARLAQRPHALPRGLSIRQAARVDANEGLYRDWSTRKMSRYILDLYRKHVGHMMTPRGEYITKVEDCQERIKDGWAYQLCLTDLVQTTIHSPPREFYHPWHIYQIMRNKNPAPFHVFLQFGEGRRRMTLIGSSPERFLSWDRDGKCEYRPMKGTIKKPDIQTEDEKMSLAMARYHFKNKKDQAENLMISDLIRNDLYGVVGADGVGTPETRVEEYETVFQLVAKIPGDFSKSKLAGSAAEAGGDEANVDGIDILAASLPPGSMTGTPKRMACQLLKEIEGERARGLYSGVAGYLDCGGGGDFSVVIRSTYHWADEDLWDTGAQSTRETWYSGGGGAITAKSIPFEEWLEMVWKLDVALSGLTRLPSAEHVWAEDVSGDAAETTNDPADHSAAETPSVENAAMDGDPNDQRVDVITGNPPVEQQLNEVEGEATAEESPTLEDVAMDRSDDDNADDSDLNNIDDIIETIMNAPIDPADQEAEDAVASFPGLDRALAEIPPNLVEADFAAHQRLIMTPRNRLTVNAGGEDEFFTYHVRDWRLERDEWLYGEFWQRRERASAVPQRGQRSE